ncbi:MAG: DUF4124 domain-containing protein [Pseudomonadota bacterium]
MRFSCLLAASVLFATVADAQVYRIQNPDGTVSFSDRPAAGAEKVDVKPVQTYSLPRKEVPEPKPLAAADESGETPPPSPTAAAVPYTRIDVVSPRNDAAMRNNSGTVLVGIHLDPPLQEGHKLNILLDGSARVEGTTDTAVSLTEVSRGTHSVRAVVVDASGAELASSTAVSFHLLRASVAKTTN